MFVIQTFATLETVLTAFHDEFPKTKKYKAQVCLAARYKRKLPSWYWCE